MKNEDIKKISDKFFSDPDWHLVEEAIHEYIDPLKDITTIDIKQDAETVKAEVIGRMISYSNMTKFLKESKILRERNNISQSME